MRKYNVEIGHASSGYYGSEKINQTEVVLARTPEAAFRMGMEKIEFKTTDGKTNVIVRITESIRSTKKVVYDHRQGYTAGKTAY